MKKGISFLIIFLMFLCPSGIYAQMPATMPAGISAASLEKIGVVAATAGKVELTTPGQVGRIAESGQAVFMGDEERNAFFHGPFSNTHQTALRGETLDDFTCENSVC